MKMGRGLIFLLVSAFFGAGKSEPNECSVFGTVVEVAKEGGFLTSPGFDTGEKVDHKKCLWVLQASEEQDKFVEITITDLDLKNDTQCTEEHLQLEYDDSVDPYLRYCGHMKPQTIVLSLKSNPRILYVSSDIHDGNRKGFRLSYTLVDHEQRCPDDMFACKQPFVCIRSEKKCDGKADCPGGQDEANCAGNKVVQPEQCGVQKVQPDFDRIVGGQDAVPDSWPWLASIQGNYIWPSGHGCGGTILNNLYVLTAAHCVVGRFFKSFRVKFGSYNQYEPRVEEFTRELETYYLHPNYSRFDSTDDLAILKLSAPIEYSDTVSPICLPDSAGEVPTGTLLYAIGWGQTENFVNSAVIRQVAVPVIGNDKCRDMVIRKLPPRTICTGHEEGGKNPCFGDSGGPLMQQINGKWVLQGAVSWGPTTCGAATEPAVYTKISDHIEWIKKTISE